MAQKHDEVDILFTEANHDFQNIWTPYAPPSQQILKKGWTQAPGRRPLPLDLIWEKDIRITLRDGVTLLGDVFRPLSSNNEPIPAILPWSPYGKTGTGQQTLDMFPWRVGVPRVVTSGLEKWEAPDPAEWCLRGYAVVNVDARGSFMSEGDIYVYGSQEGRDGYDTIEWIAGREWCNGSVALAGNSWLATTQWFIAAEQPPHLKAIAPWEGLGDYYRESICRGGIPCHAFWDILFTWFSGQNQREDVSAMVDKYGRWNAYWEDKKPKLGHISIPMYVLASYSTGLHTEGSIRGYFLSASQEKWLRFNITQEWHDQYQPESLDDLQCFFDKYLKGIDNGWDMTPRIRLSLLGYNRPSVVNRPAPSYPPPEFRYTKLYLDVASGQLIQEPRATPSSAEYNAESMADDGCLFTHTFANYTELCGFSKVKLFMSTREHDDMDVYVVIRKLGADGTPLQNLNIPLKDLPPDTGEDSIPHDNIWRYVGPNGRLRASHRRACPEPGLTPDQRKSISQAYVWHPHDCEEKLEPGQVVELDIHLWPGGIIFDRNESLRLEIKGRLPIEPEFEGLDQKICNFNVGRHLVHTGGNYPSFLLVALSGSE